MRKFEKISFEQFKKDICDDLELYNNYDYLLDIVLDQRDMTLEVLMKV